MINLTSQIRRATTHDRHQISNLLFHESYTHRHLDWRSALEWIGAQNYWVIEEHGFITAAFACPEDPPNVAWIRLFAHHPHHNAQDAWSVLWETARAEIFNHNSEAEVSAIVMKNWFQQILLQSGFKHKQNITLLKLQIENFNFQPSLKNIRIRAMTAIDLTSVAKLDLEAFGYFWHNTTDSLQRAYRNAVHASIAENDSGILGYQISTGNRSGAHLARLAVCPEAQGQGVASMLVHNLIQYLNVYQNNTLSVNTQDDNFSSLAFYKKMGFIKTGEQFPVLVYGV